jgi:hypothetical protein
MDSPGHAWAIILSNPELREGVIREAARSRRSCQSASNQRTLWRWLGIVVRRFAARPELAVVPDARPMPVTEVE